MTVIIKKKGFYAREKVMQKMHTAFCKLLLCERL
jgi:hypothetical protein